MNMRIIIGIVIFLLGFNTPSFAKEGKSIAIAASSSIQEPLKVICEKFAEATSYQCHVLSSSTGHLYAQIMHGANYDLLISSDEAYSQGLIKADKAHDENRFIVARCRIVLWSKDETLDVESLKMKLIDANSTVVISNPGSTPYGLAAKEILQGCNLWRSLQGRLIYGRSFGETYKILSEKQSLIGFVSLAQLSEEERKTGRYWEPDLQMYHPVSHELIVLNSATHKGSVRAFIAFLHTKAACEVLHQAGYQCGA